MPKKVEYTPYSEEIAVPFEVFQTYFQKADKRRTQTRWLFVLSLVLGLAVLALVVALPFLAPMLAVSTLASAAGLLEVYLIAIVPLTLFIGFSPSFVFGAEFSRNPDFHLTENSIQILPHTYFFTGRETRILQINPPGITLSKVKKDNTEYTLVSPNQGASIGQNILGSSVIEANTFSILAIIMADLEEKKIQLEGIQDSLSKQMNNPSNSINKISRLSSKLSKIREQMTHCDQTLNTVKPVFDKMAFKNEVERKYRLPLQELVVFLENHKKNVAHINRKNIKINQNIEQLKKEQKNHPGLVILSEKIQMLETLKRNNLKLAELRSILHSIDTIRIELDNMKRGRSQSDIDDIKYAIDKLTSDKQILSGTIPEIDPVLYIEYFTEEATRHYSRLLHNKTSNQETMQLLNNILRDHPNSKHTVNQKINYILANHFYRKFKNNRKEAIIEKACLAALKLDSSDAHNAELKEMIILHAFYKDPKNTELPIGIKNLLLTSDSNPEAYTAIKKILETKPPIQQTAVQFSNSKPNSPTPSSSEPMPSSDPPKPFG